MTKRGTRLFFLGGTLAATLVLLVLTVDSHRQFPRLTHADQITPAVVAGKHVWHRKNCVNCHTLMGEGAYYAPDLTKITEQRGVPYLQAFLKDPSKLPRDACRAAMAAPLTDEPELTSARKGALAERSGLAERRPPPPCSTSLWRPLPRIHAPGPTPGARCCPRPADAAAASRRFHSGAGCSS